MCPYSSFFSFSNRRWILFPIIISTAAWGLTIITTFSCESVSSTRLYYEAEYKELNSVQYDDMHRIYSIYNYNRVMIGGSTGMSYSRCGGLYPGKLSKLDYQPTETEISTFERKIDQQFFAYGMLAIVLGGIAMVLNYLGCCIAFRKKEIACIMAGYLLAGWFFLFMVLKMERMGYDICMNNTLEKLVEGELDLQQNNLYDICYAKSWIYHYKPSSRRGYGESFRSEYRSVAIAATCLWLVCPTLFFLYVLPTLVRKYIIAPVRNYHPKYYYPEPAELENCNNRRRVVAVVKRNGLLLRNVSPALRDDEQILRAAAKQNPEALRYVNNKEVALDVVGRNPDTIKYVQEDLKRDPEILIAARMFDKNHDIERNNSIKKIVLSTRFSLDASSHSEATNFTFLLKDHEYILSNFILYAPNAFDKKTCDPNWTDFDHQCRGTMDTCQYNNILTDDGRPTDDCCWRYSFRSQLEEAKDTGGFMLQLVEADKQGKGIPQKLGNGQTIELDMAQNHLKMKAFHVYRPRWEGGNELRFNNGHINEVVLAIKSWYNNNCEDMSVTIIHPSPWR